MFKQLGSLSYRNSVFLYRAHAIAVPHRFLGARVEQIPVGETPYSSYAASPASPHVRRKTKPPTRGGAPRAWHWHIGREESLPVIAAPIKGKASDVPDVAWESLLSRLTRANGCLVVSERQIETPSGGTHCRPTSAMW
jgi:hypothetical protein